MKSRECNAYTVRVALLETKCFVRTKYFWNEMNESKHKRYDDDWMIGRTIEKEVEICVSINQLIA